MVAMSVAGCSSDVTPTNPTGTPSVAGTWAGTYHVKSCTDTINGAPGTVCPSLVDSPDAPNPASTQPVQVTITQQQDQLTGTLAFSGWYVLNVPVTGRVDVSGRMWLQGSGTISDAGCPTTSGQFSVSGWVSDLNRSHDGMSGVFTLSGTKRLSACLFSNYTLQADGVLINLKGSSSTPTSPTTTSKH